MSVMSVSLSSARVIVWVSLCVTFCLILIVICLMYVWCSVFPILSSQRVKSFSIWMLQKDEKSIKMGRHLPKWNPWWWHGGYQEGKHSLLFLFSSETSKILYVCVSPCWAEVVYTAKHLWHLKCVKAKQVLYGDLKHMFDTSRGWTWNFYSKHSIWMWLPVYQEGIFHVSFYVFVSLLDDYRCKLQPWKEACSAFCFQRGFFFSFCILFRHHYAILLMVSELNNILSGHLLFCKLKHLVLSPILKSMRYCV